MIRNEASLEGEEKVGTVHVLGHLSISCKYNLSMKVIMIIYYFIILLLFISWYCI